MSDPALPTIPTLQEMATWSPRRRELTLRLLDKIQERQAAIARKYELPAQQADIERQRSAIAGEQQALTARLDALDAQDRRLVADASASDADTIRLTAELDQLAHEIQAEKEQAG